MRCFKTDARMIVIKDENAGIVFVTLSADSAVAWAQVTIFDVFRQGRFPLRGSLDCLALPGTILPMGGNNDPFLSQGMPAFFPLVSFCAH